MGNFSKNKGFEQEVLKNCDMSCSTGEGEEWYNQVLLHDYDQSQILDAVKRTYLDFCSCCGERRRRKVSNFSWWFQCFRAEDGFQGFDGSNFGGCWGASQHHPSLPFGHMQDKVSSRSKGW